MTVAHAQAHKCERLRRRTLREGGGHKVAARWQISTNLVVCCARCTEPLPFRMSGESPPPSSPSLRRRRPPTPYWRPSSATKCAFGGNKHKLCANEDCDFCFERSLAAHELHQQFRGLVGDPLMPARSITSGSHSIGRWECGHCPHTFTASIDTVCGRKRSWCPYCQHKVLCGCAWCFKHSLADTDAAEDFVEFNDGKDAACVPKYSGAKATFHCSLCNHSFEQIVKNRVMLKQGCPYCSVNSPLLCNASSCTHCLARSVASVPRMLKLWKDERNPRTVLLGHCGKAQFHCDVHGTWTSIVRTVSGGSGCPSCTHKAEGHVVVFLQEAHVCFKKEWTTAWCKDVQVLPFDFLLQLKVPSLLETDGFQHFDAVGFWGGLFAFRRLRQHDVHKMRCVIAKGFPMIRMLSETVLKDCRGWRGWLKDVFATRCRLRDGVAPLILQDCAQYRQMYVECLKDDPAIPIVEFVPMV